MSEEIKNISISSQDKQKKMPEGAQIVTKNVDIRSRKIENGYVLTKSYDIQYELNGEMHWHYVTKEYYSKTNPVEVKVKEGKKSLADQFE